MFFLMNLGARRVWFPDVNFNCFHGFQWYMIYIYVIWIKIFNGIEYEHHISLNIRIMADHVTLAFLAFLESIFKLEP